MRACTGRTNVLLQQLVVRLAARAFEHGGEERISTRAVRAARARIEEQGQRVRREHHLARGSRLFLGILGEEAVRNTGGMVHQLFDGHPLAVHVLGQPSRNGVPERRTASPLSSRVATMIVSGFVIDATLVGVVGVNGTRKLVIGEAEGAFHEHSSATGDQKRAGQLASGEGRDVRLDRGVDQRCVVEPSGGLREPRRRRGRELRRSRR